jgi:hypothetical protein
MKQPYVKVTGNLAPTLPLFQPNSETYGIWDSSIKGSYGEHDQISYSLRNLFLSIPTAQLHVKMSEIDPVILNCHIAIFLTLLYMAPMFPRIAVFATALVFRSLAYELWEAESTIIGQVMCLSYCYKLWMAW